MPKFMSNHTLPPGQFTREQLSRFTQAAQEDPKVRGYRSFANLSEGKVVCILEAPDRKDIAVWFQKMELPYDNITQLEIEGDRGVIEEA
jgi:hypothetical protein